MKLLNKSLPIFLLLCLIALGAQSQVNCDQVLAKARAAYENGRVKGIEEMLNPCINNGFTDEQKQEAYRLIIKAKIYDEQLNEAKAIMLKMLGEFPEYEIKDNDPREFTLLFDEFVTSPLWSYGGFAGINYIIGRQLEEFGTYNSEDLDYDKFQSTGISFHVGGRVNRYLAKNIELQLDVMLEFDQFTQTINAGNYDIIRVENQNYVSFPLSATYDFPKTRVGKPYARLGFNTSFLWLGASSNSKLEYTDGSPNSNEDISYDELKEIRKSIMFSAVVGAGLKFKIPKAYVFIDARYRYGLNNIVNADGRYDVGKNNANYNRLFGAKQVDDNFTLDRITLSIGIVKNIYKPRAKKQVE